MKDLSLDYINKFMNKNKQYKIDYRGKLNEEQYEATLVKEGPCLVVAGAGTGKTTVITLRVARLIEDDISPEDILILTFTKKAAKEMINRLSLLLDDRCKRVNGGTYHAFAANILRKYAKLVGIHNNFNILDGEDTKDVINVIRSELHLNKKERMFPDKSVLANIFSMSINKCISIQDLVSSSYPEIVEDIPDIEKCFERFQEFKLEKSLLDYDDLLLRLCELLENHPDVAEYLSNKFRYIMVDEYQDSNLLQLRFLRGLCTSHKNLFVVGDPMQSIYAFRGANFQNIMNFPQQFPDCKVVKLSKNYRCSQPILDIANNIMDKAVEKIYNPLESDKKTNEKPLLVTTKDEYKQSLFIVQEILKLKEEGQALSDIGILVRNAYLSNNLELILNSCNVPYTKIGGLKFLDKAHIKDVLSFLRVIANVNDVIAWTRLLQLFENIGGTKALNIANLIDKDNSINTLVSSKFKKVIYSESLQELFCLFNNISDCSLSEQIDSILKFYKPLAKRKYEDYGNREDDLSSFKDITSRYTSITKFLTDLILEPNETTEAKEEDKVEDFVTITTIHSAKGLEWKYVFVIGAIDGVIPSSKSLGTISETEEERRLMYVAITRAKSKLYVTVPKSVSRFGNYTETEISRFITEDKNNKRFFSEFNVN